MKILCVTPWKNTWISYWDRYIKSRGHEVKWYIGPRLREHLEFVTWADAVLSQWADKFVILLSNIDNIKPLYVIVRSYEIFNRDGWSDLGKINWKNIKQTFMLNEMHYHMFKRRVRDVKPIFIKNGIDLDEWCNNWEIKDRDKIAWIADIQEKKGVELLVQAIFELNKINPNANIQHLGRNMDIRRTYYLDNLMPKLNKKSWFMTEYNNSHGFVRQFLQDKKFIISTSVAEGNPMNIIEAMAVGVIPLIHTWPGADIQFPKECLWANFDQLRDCYQRLDSDIEAPKRMRAWAEDRYDYRKNFKVVVDIIEDNE